MCESVVSVRVGSNCESAPHVRRSVLCHSLMHTQKLGIVHQADGLEVDPEAPTLAAQRSEEES